MEVDFVVLVWFALPNLIRRLFVFDDDSDVDYFTTYIELNP